MRIWKALEHMQRVKTVSPSTNSVLLPSAESLEEKVAQVTSTLNPISRAAFLIELRSTLRTAVEHVFGPPTAGCEQDIHLYKVQFQDVFDRESGIDRDRFGPFVTTNRILCEQLEKLVYRTPDYPYSLLALTAILELALEQTISLARQLA